MQTHDGVSWSLGDSNDKTYESYLCLRIRPGDVCAAQLSDRNDFYTLVLQGWNRESSRAHGAPTQVMFSYQADNLLTSKTRGPEHIGHMAVEEMKLTIVGALLRIVSHGVAKRLAMNDRARICDNKGVVIRVSEDMICQQFAMGIIGVQRRWH